jgi:hypothetical protein
MSKPLGGEKYSPEQKLELLKEYMAYSIDTRVENVRALNRFFDMSRETGDVVFPLFQKVISFEGWMAARNIRNAVMECNFHGHSYFYTREFAYNWNQHVRRWVFHRGLEVLNPKRDKS